MKKTVGALAGVAMILGSAGVAGATEFARGIPQDARPPMTLSPETGVPGSSFTVSGEGCTSGEVSVVQPGPYVQDSTPDVVVALDGSWTASFTLEHNVGPNTTVRIEADCLESDGGQVDANAFRGQTSEVLFSYQTAYFTVVEDPTLTLTPASGEAGSTFTVKGGTCFSQFADEDVTVSAGGETKMVTADSKDGTWSATFDVPDDAAIGSTIDVEATCAFPNYDDDQPIPSIRRAPAGEVDVDTFDYDAAVFTVTGETTTTQGTTPTTAAGAVEATAATATTATPTFTG